MRDKEDVPHTDERGSDILDGFLPNTFIFSSNLGGGGGGGGGGGHVYT